MGTCPPDSRMVLPSWPKLDKPTMNLWREHLANNPPQRGFHPGGVVVMNEYRGEWASLSHYKRSRYQRLMTADMIDYDDQGKILIAIDPFSAGAGKQVEQIIKSWRKGKKAVKKGKARIGQWGDIISKFESGEFLRKRGQKRDDQLFARYRRVIGGKHDGPDEINFDLLRSSCMKSLSEFAKMMA